MFPTFYDKYDHEFSLAISLRSCKSGAPKTIALIRGNSEILPELSKWAASYPVLGSGSAQRSHHGPTANKAGGQEQGGRAEKRDDRAVGARKKREGTGPEPGSARQAGPRAASFRLTKALPQPPHQGRQGCRAGHGKSLLSILATSETNSNWTPSNPENSETLSDQAEQEAELWAYPAHVETSRMYFLQGEDLSRQP